MLGEIGSDGELLKSYGLIIQPHVSGFSSGARHYQFDFGSEAITALGNGLDVMAAIRLFAQSAPHGRDVLRQITLFDKTVGPDCLHQSIFFNDVTAILNQDEQDLKGFEREWYWLTILL